MSAESFTHMRDYSRAQRISAKAPIRHIDYSLLLVTMGLTVIGCLAVKSASRFELQTAGVDANVYLKRQIVYSALSLIVMLIVLLFDYRQARNLSPLIYALGVLFLIIILTPLGSAEKGAQRWIDLGILRIQPSELMKVVLVVALAAFLARERTRSGIVQMFSAMGLTALPALLVYLQPDLGTAMVFFAVVFAVLVASGTRIRWLGLLVLGGMVAFTLALQLGILRDYQVARLTAFLDSDSDPQRAGFNLAQSKIAIGSGGLTGRGMGQGLQTNLSYVPHQQTDFIFTVIGEESGFVGGILIVALFSFLLWRCLRIAMLSKDRFGTLLAVGIAAMFGFQIFVNIGMTVGIMPITGIPLPFLSYGGSSLITSYVAVGLLMNVHMRRFV